VKEDQFLRDFASRLHPDLIFFLGAGASKSSGIPTAWELTWYFKRDIYSSRNNISPEALKDITLPNIQKAIQSWIDINFPVVDSNEYAFFFEKAYPPSQARKRIISKYVSSSSTSIGYQSLGALIRNKKIRNIITTNFDNLTEKVYSDIYVVSDESFHRAADLEIAGEKVQLIKLHGDFRYDLLRNTSGEIQQINNQIEERLKDFYKEFGIVVIGYSGRDNSVMSLIEQLSDEYSVFSKGFYWCIRSGDSVDQRVQDIIIKLREKGIDADFVEIDSFDDFMVHLFKQVNLQDEVIEKLIKEKYEQRLPLFFNKDKGKPPAIMTNSLRIEEYPTTAYKFETDIDSWEEIGKTIGENDIIASLSKGPSIIAIGNRPLIEDVFKGHIKNQLELFNILDDHLMRLNSNHGFVFKLYYDIFSKYFESALGLNRFGKRTFMASTTMERYQSKWIRLTCSYCQAFTYSLEYREKELFLIVKPTVIPMRSDKSRLDPEIAKVLTNEILSSTYNSEMRQMLGEWLKVLKKGKQKIEIAYPINVDPPSARFIIDGSYSYSMMR
jgi:hypothetical protein